MSDYIASLSLDQGISGKSIQLVYDYLMLQPLVQIQQNADKIFLTMKDKEQPITEVATITRLLCQLSPRGQELLGNEELPSKQALVNEWITYAVNKFDEVTDNVLNQVALHLQNKVYITGSQLSLADILLFARLHDSMVLIPAAQTMTFCNLLRWFDLLQNTILTPSSALESVLIKKPPFKKPKLVEDLSKKPKIVEQNGKQAKTEEKSKETKPKEAEKKKEAQAKSDKKKGGEPSSSKAGDEARVDQLDIRIGKIVAIEKHPNADALYVEQIDLGEDKPRQIISGLVKFVTEEQMLNRLVAVITNLKPAKMRDLMSNGMVLCASNDEHTKVFPVLIPEGVLPGEKVKIEGYDNEPDKEINNAKKKTLDKIFPDLKTDGNGIAQYKGVMLTTSKGPITSKLVSAWIK